MREEDVLVCVVEASEKVMKEGGRLASSTLRAMLGGCKKSRALKGRYACFHHLQLLNMSFYHFYDHGPSGY